MYLRAVLTGVAVGPCEPDTQHVVDDAAAPVQQVTIHHAARLLRTGGAAVSGAEHAVQRRQCVGAGQAQNADGAGQLGRGDGSDGVGHGGEPPCGRFFQYTTADVKRKGRGYPALSFFRSAARWRVAASIAKQETRRMACLLFYWVVTRPWEPQRRPWRQQPSSQQQPSAQP